MSIKNELQNLVDKGLLEADVCETFKERLYNQLKEKNKCLKSKLDRAVNGDFD